MTRYVDIHDMRHLIRQLGAQRMSREMEACIREDFLRWEDFQKSARMANHSKGGVIELMPVSDQKLYAFKYVNGHPGNPRVRMSTVMAFGVLADVLTGYPLLLSELTITTALRTAATSVMAAAALARPGARSMALIGNGAQSEFQALAFADRLGIRELRVFDVDPRATAKLLANLAPQIRSGQLQVRRAASIRDAVRGADIVTTATADKANATILTADLLEPGMHINALGGDCPGKTELAAEVLHRAKVFVEYEPQTRIEGELQQMPADFPVTALWEVLAGRAAGRDDAEQVTLFDSVGFALEDLSALRYLHRLALAHGVGRDIDLVPTMDDPKDLFGYSQQDTLAARKAA
ncbi:ornithine cyclodeaminase [Variovorax humicola]|uniref:Ornithine cyclodeaminase n=1 Tax=Variovorax humicola TaxID=1769758 RepID=A0ABU8W868_9BURK